jgi:hypothetical protein
MVLLIPALLIPGVISSAAEAAPAPDRPRRCIEMNNFCERFCPCGGGAGGCTNGFPGCACRRRAPAAPSSAGTAASSPAAAAAAAAGGGGGGGSGGCRGAGCPCWDAFRECEPDTCRCGAAETLEDFSAAVRRSRREESARAAAAAAAVAGGVAPAEPGFPLRSWQFRCVHPAGYIPSL